MYPIMLLFIIPVIFVIFWCFVTALVSLAGGWFFTAKEFPAPVTLQNETKTFIFQTLYFGFFSRYRSVITVKIYKKGIFLKPIFIFAFLHNAIFIPWESIKASEAYNTIVKGISICFGNRKITLYGRSAACITEMLKDLIQN